MASSDPLTDEAAVRAATEAWIEAVFALRPVPLQVLLTAA